MNQEAGYHGVMALSKALEGWLTELLHASTEHGVWVRLEDSA